MTGARQSIVGTDLPCCDFESLSCHADGELEPEAAAVVAEHLNRCPRCAALATRLRERFEADDAQRDGGLGGSGCWDEEHLVLYAAGGMRGAEQATLAGHLAECDACVAAVTVLHRHLALLSAAPATVPAELHQRALRAFDGAAVPAPARLQQSQWARWSARLDRVRGLFRLPVLVPAALAVGAVLAVVWQPASLDRATSGERSRAVVPSTVTRRVTAVEATMHSRPSLQSEVVGTLHRGALVEVSGEEREWYEVRAAGGPPGWVEREAVE